MRSGTALTVGHPCFECLDPSAFSLQLCVQSGRKQTWSKGKVQDAFMQLKREQILGLCRRLVCSCSLCSSSALQHIDQTLLPSQLSDHVSLLWSHRYQPEGFVYLQLVINHWTVPISLNYLHRSPSAAASQMDWLKQKCIWETDGCSRRLSWRRFTIQGAPTASYKPTHQNKMHVPWPPRAICHA